jgi:hypothetical protein
MTSPFRGVPLRYRAIDLMKQGHTAEAIHQQFVAEGEHPDEVRSVLTELVALQHEAAARDPVRLRGEAKWMFLRGASVDHVVAHFATVGVAEEHARPEAERILVEVRRMRPCQRCGMAAEPESFVMDLSGFSICSGCNLRDEIGRSEQRGIERDIETIGGIAGFGGALAMSLAADAHGQHGYTSRPFCAHCRTPTGFHVSSLDPGMRARLDPSWQWVCGQCWQKIA